MAELPDHRQSQQHDLCTDVLQSSSHHVRPSVNHQELSTFSIIVKAHVAATSSTVEVHMRPNTFSKPPMQHSFYRSCITRGRIHLKSDSPAQISCGVPWPQRLCGYQASSLRFSPLLQSDSFAQGVRSSDRSLNKLPVFQHSSSSFIVAPLSLKSPSAHRKSD